MFNKKFELIIDASQFMEQNEVQSQWINQFLQTAPPELAENIECVYIFNANMAFRKFSKQFQRLISAKISKRLHFFTAISEFHDFISPMELRLPKSTGKCNINYSYT